MSRQKILLAFSMILGSFLSQEAQAQDPTFSQFYANPMYLNPALAGGDGCPKIHVNQRDQWPRLKGEFLTTAISYDKDLAKINSGYGVQLVYDNAGNGLLNSVRLSGMYSYKMKVNKKYYVLAGADLAFNYKSLDKDLLVFGDQIDPTTGDIFAPNSAEKDNIESNRGFIDLSFGAVGYSEKFYLGFAAHHLNKPDDSFFISNTVNGQIINPQSELPMKFTAHAGANFSISGNAKKGIIADGPFMTAGLIWQNQGAADQLNLGLSLTDKSLSGGVWYRRNSENSDAIILVAGYTIHNTTLGFSYDITVSDLSGETGGAFEISARFQLPCRQPKKRIEPMTCPKF